MRIFWGSLNNWSEFAFTYSTNLETNEQIDLLNPDIEAVSKPKASERLICIFSQPILRTILET